VGFHANWTQRPRNVSALAVVSQEVVNIEAGSADGRMLVEAGMRSSPVVEAGPRSQVGAAVGRQSVIPAKRRKENVSMCASGPRGDAVGIPQRLYRRRCLDREPIQFGKCKLSAAHQVVRCAWQVRQAAARLELQSAPLGTSPLFPEDVNRGQITSTFISPSTHRSHSICDVETLPQREPRLQQALITGMPVSTSVRREKTVQKHAQLEHL